MVGVLYIHGMGKDKLNSHEKMINNIRKHTNVEIVCEPVYYYEEIQDNQNAMIRRMGDLGLGVIRDFVISSLGDVGTIGYNSSLYVDTMESIRCGLRRLSHCKHIVVIGHSFGCQMFSCFMWDESLSGRVWPIKRLFTTGCNIPIFVGGLDEDKIEPISKPHPDFKWINFWFSLDILGYPLAPLSPKYQLLVEDIKVKSMIPFLCHNMYDDCRAVYSRIAKEIEVL